MFKRTKRKQVYQDQWLTFYQDEIIRLDGSPGTYVWVDRKDGVGIVVTTPDRKIFFNKEFRYVINEFSWEIPGGGIDEGESPDQAAVRELQEETGLEVESVEKLGVFYPLNSFNTETVSLFHAEISAAPATTDQTEVGEHMAEQCWITFEEALKMIDEGRVTDAMTVAAVQMVIRKLDR